MNEDTKTLKEVINEGFADNKIQHEKIYKVLFGNDELGLGLVGKMAMNDNQTNALCEVNERILVKLENIELFNARLSAQISLWKYIMSLLGMGNIATILYFFVK